MAFNRAVADMGKAHNKKAPAAPQQQQQQEVDELSLSSEELELDRIVLSDDINATRMHQLAISLRPLVAGAGGSGSTGATPTLTASRWEVRKAIMSLCCTPPTMFEVTTAVTDTILLLITDSGMMCCTCILYNTVILGTRTGINLNLGKDRLVVYYCYCAHVLVLVSYVVLCVFMCCHSILDSGWQSPPFPVLLVLPHLYLL